MSESKGMDELMRHIHENTFHCGKLIKVSIRLISMTSGPEVSSALNVEGED